MKCNPSTVPYKISPGLPFPQLTRLYIPTKQSFTPGHWTALLEHKIRQVKGHRAQTKDVHTWQVKGHGAQTKDAHTWQVKGHISSAIIQSFKQQDIKELS